MHEREIAVGKYQVLKKEIYELGVKAQALVSEIQSETETFLSEKDFSTMDFNKVITLAKELKLLQKDFEAKKEKFILLQKTYDIAE
jgi:hypothetical protein